MTLTSGIFDTLGRVTVALGLHTLQRRLPHAHRGWIYTGRGQYGIRPETNREYLARLKQLARERDERNEQVRLRDSVRGDHRFRA